MKPLKLNTLEVPGAQPDAAGPAEAVATPAQQTDFTKKLGEAISAVDQLQVEADGQSQQLAAGAGNLHETMLALEKADVAMRVAMKVRNKILDAYNEVMRMPV